MVDFWLESFSQYPCPPKKRSAEQPRYRHANKRKSCFASLFALHESSTGSIRNSYRMSDMDAVRDSDNFEYVRLDASRRETRLVKLHPGRDSDPISCTVQHIRVGDTRDYETVSYC